MEGEEMLTSHGESYILGGKEEGNEDWGNCTLLHSVKLAEVTLKHCEKSVGIIRISEEVLDLPSWNG